MQVRLVERAEQVMNTLDADMGAIVFDAVQAAGVRLHRQENLEGFEVSNGRLRAVVTDQRILPAELVLLGLGVRPNTALAKAAGIPLGVKDAIKVNQKLQNEVEGIWAAGDCVQSYHLVSRRPFHVALGTVANKQGRIAGINLGGSSAAFPGAVGTAITKFKELEVARSGLQESELKDMDYDYTSEKITGTSRTGYWPAAGTITVKLHAEKGGGRLLGGQIVGTQGAGKRIDVLATALHVGMGVDEMIHLYLSYAPPFAPAWAPILIAVRQILKRI